MKIIKPGVKCRVIGGSLPDSPNRNKIVIVDFHSGEHSTLGNIWRCTFISGEGISEYGGIGPSLDFAEAWLEPLEDKENTVDENANSIRL